MSRLTQQQQKILMSSLNTQRIKSRPQGRTSVSYLEAWDVRATLIRVFGYGGFDAEVTDSGIIHMEQTDVAYKPDNGGRGAPLEYKVIKYVDPSTGVEDAKRAKHWNVTAHATMRLRVRFNDGTVATYTEVAIASQKGPDLGEVADFAQKTAESDALKRAAVNLGTQFGMSLYDEGKAADVVRFVFAPGQEWANGESLRGDEAGEPVAEVAEPAGEYPGAAKTAAEAEAQLQRANLRRRETPAATESEFAEDALPDTHQRGRRLGPASEEPTGNYSYQGDTADPS